MLFYVLLSLLCLIKHLQFLFAFQSSLAIISILLSNCLLGSLFSLQSNDCKLLYYIIFVRGTRSAEESEDNIVDGVEVVISLINARQMLAVYENKVAILCEFWECCTTAVDWIELWVLDTIQVLLIGRNGVGLNDILANLFHA